MVGLCSVDAAEKFQGRFSHAVYLLNNGIYFEAAALLEHYIEEHPDHEAAHLQLAKALFHLKRHSESARLAAEVLRLNPANRDAKRLLTQLRITLGRELDTTDPKAILVYAELCKHTDAYGRAAAFYERYMVYRPKDDATRLELARLLSWSGRYERSAHHYYIYLEKYPKNFTARHEIGRVLNSAGRFSEAIVFLGQCLEDQPENLKLILDMAQATWWGGKADGHTDLLRQAVNMNTNKLADLNFLVGIARKMNWPDAEYILYERILDLHPDDRIAAANKEAYDDAQTIKTLHIRKRVVQNPDDPELRTELIQHLIEQEDLGEALGELNRLSRNDPVRIELNAAVEKLRRRVGLRSMGLLKDTKEDVRGQQAEYIAACRDWLKKHPDDQRTRGLLAYYLSADEQEVDAAQEYRIILRTYPTVNPTIASRIKVLDKLGEQKGVTQ
jgi:tetratricopeptide (TPR) repeat protein